MIEVQTMLEIIVDDVVVDADVRTIKCKDREEAAAMVRRMSLALRRAEQEPQPAEQK